MNGTSVNPQTQNRSLNFSGFLQGVVTTGRLSKEDAAYICVEAVDTIPETGLVFEVSVGLLIQLWAHMWSICVVNPKDKV